MLIIQVFSWRPPEDTAVSLCVQKHTWHANVSEGYGAALTTALSADPNYNHLLLCHRARPLHTHNPSSLLTRLMKKHNAGGFSCVATQAFKHPRLHLLNRIVFTAASSAFEYI